MKLFLCLGITYCLYIPNGYAQLKSAETERVLVYPPFKLFFKEHPSIKELHFSKFWGTDLLEIDVTEEDTTIAKALNHFHLETKTDSYFFQKRFGKFFFPDSLFLQWIDKTADVVRLHGAIRGDSIFFIVEETHYPKNDDEKIFIKVEEKYGYPKGLHELALSE